MTTAGYYLGGIPLIQRHFEKVVILIVLLSVLPVVFEILKSRRAIREVTREVVTERQ
jgi:membrane-associated protein